MYINPISSNNQNISFNSKFIKTDTLSNAFDYAIKTGNKKFLKSVTNLLNDNIHREISINSKINKGNLHDIQNYQYTQLDIKGDLFKTQMTTTTRLILDEEMDSFMRIANNVAANDAIDLINNFAGHVKNKKISKMNLSEVRQALNAVKSEIFKN